MGSRRFSRRVLELPLLTPGERDRMLALSSGGSVPRRDLSFADLFEAQVARAPEACAVVCGEERINYRELNRRANQLTHHLYKQDVGRGTLVAIFADRSVNMVVALLAVLKAGAAFVPLDPDYPRERLTFMLEDSGARVLLTAEALLPRLPETRAQVVCLDRDWPLVARESVENLPSGTNSADLAYVIYTSGSTGRPKGVLLEHRGLCNVVDAQFEVLGVRPDSHILQFASFSFDASIFEVVLALGAGAALYLEPRISLLPGPELVRYLLDHEITTLLLPPSALALLPVESLPKLEMLMVAGEACPPELVARWAPGRRFFNLYGPTEATIWVTFAECHADGPTHIGRPIANVHVYVLDPRGEPTPIGVAGELYVGGAGVARGYLNRPELTRECFLPDPFSTGGLGRLYRTGDLVRWRADGTLDYLGRRDQQVKLRGHRVEPGEIEAVLRAHPAVRAAVVVAGADATGGTALVAYVVVSGATGAELRAHLKARLPAFMVPSAVVPLAELPLTPNGKTDRRALAKLGAARRELEDAFVAPATDLEQRLAEIWSALLGVERIGAYDSFFDLGGHSLLITQLISRVRDAFAVELPLREFFAAPTVAATAQRIETLAWAAQHAAAGAALQADEEGEI